MNRFVELEDEIKQYTNANRYLLVGNKKISNHPKAKSFGSKDGLNTLPNYEHLLLFQVPSHIISNLKGKNMKVQYAHNEGYNNDLNIDFYSAKITKMPIMNGVTMTSQELIKHIRLNMNSFINTKYSSFKPYSSSIDTPIWNSDNPLGAVVEIDIMGPDNASVVCSFVAPNNLGWGFTTVTTPKTGEHPVSGNREFFISEKSNHKLFVIKGLDISSTGIPGLGLPIFEGYGYKVAKKLWQSMQSKVIKFINANGGKAEKAHSSQHEIEWRLVYYRYMRELKSAFGAGAGAA